ncbi:hypothetical protein D3C72_1552940 [compost metagenome]
MPHDIGLGFELFLALQAAAQLDDLEHVHELAFVIGAFGLAKEGVIGKLHLGQGRGDHFRVVDVGKGAHAVAHELQVVELAGAVGLHIAREGDGLG